MKRSRKREYRGGNDGFKELAYLAEEYGYVCVRHTGSHYIFKNKVTGRSFPANLILNDLVKKRLIDDILLYA